MLTLVPAYFSVGFLLMNHMLRNQCRGLRFSMPPYFDLGFMRSVFVCCVLLLKECCSVQFKAPCYDLALN